MKLGIVSDLHLEFHPNMEDWVDLATSINLTKCDLIINAGDIHPSPELRNHFHKMIKVPYKHILGNHDFYGQQTIKKSHLIHEDHEGLMIAGATLWTDFNKKDPYLMSRFPQTLADGTQILANRQYPTIAEEMYDIFMEDLDWIDQTNPDVVITHHSPSARSIAPKFRASGDINYYFMSDLDNFILDHPRIKLWVHGHMHNFSDYMIGTCRVIANPLGYPNETYRHITDYNPLIVIVGV